jgi:hypothetical protein
VDFIERVFHVSPDNGDGTFELVLLMLVVAIVFVGLWRRRGRRWRHPGNRL